jgi:hypothetical protein
MVQDTRDYQTQYRSITIRTIDGSTLYGKVNIAANERVSDLFASSDINFIVMVDVLFKDSVGKTMFINKEHIVWVEPEEG